MTANESNGKIKIVGALQTGEEVIANADDEVKTGTVVIEKWEIKNNKTLVRVKNQSHSRLLFKINSVCTFRDQIILLNRNTKTVLL